MSDWVAVLALVMGFGMGWIIGSMDHMARHK